MTRRGTVFKTEILDTTLREGEQCFGVFFAIEVKKRLAVLLDEIGVDFIEVGHPAAAPSIRKAVSEIANLNLRAKLVGHARLERSEITLVRELGLSWVGLFCGINESSRKRYNLSKQANYDRIADSVTYAKELGLCIKFTCEDASRTEFRDLVEFYELLASLGVDRLSYADTVGIARPKDIETLHCRIKEKVPFESLHFHFHDDFGSARENAVEAVRKGARCIDASVLGIGERAGLVSLEDILAFRNRNSGQEDRRSPFREAAELVRSCINQDHYRQRMFAHKSGIHLNGTIKDQASYEPVEPESAGAKRILVLSKMIGRSGLKALLSRHGFCHIEADIRYLLQVIKSEEMLELAGAEEIDRYFMGKGLDRQSVKACGPASTSRSF